MVVALVPNSQYIPIDILLLCVLYSICGHCVITTSEALAGIIQNTSFSITISSSSDILQHAIVGRFRTKEMEVEVLNMVCDAK